MAAWSIDWRTDIVFGCKKISSMFVSLEMGWCAGQPSMIIAIFFFHLRRILDQVCGSSVRRFGYSSNSSFVQHAGKTNI